MSTWINFAEIREKVTLEDVLLRYYRLGDHLKRQGDKLVGACPIHNGDSPRAFHAELKKNAWFCFSRCRKGGNQIDFVAAKEGIAIREAALLLHDFFLGGTTAAPPRPPAPAPSARESDPSTAELSSATGPPSAPSTEGPAVNPPLELRLTLLPDHPHLLKERALSLETVKRFGVGYCQRGILRGMIAIPIHDEDGDLVAYAGRRLKWADIREHGKYKFPKGFRKEFVLYNLDRAKTLADKEGLVLVEGFFSVLALADRGIQNAVAVMGCTLSEAQAEILAETTSWVTILFDGNDAGRGGASEAQERLEQHGVHTAVVKLPEGYEPEDLSAKALRWVVNGVRVLDLTEVALAFRAKTSNSE